MVNSFELAEEDSLSSGSWLLEWNDETFVLRDPGGTVVLESRTAMAHRLVELTELYAADKVSLLRDGGSITFEVHRAAGRAVRELVNNGLRNDDDYRAEQKKIARGRAPTAAGMFLGFGGLFALYCWILVGLDDKGVNPPGWVKALGGFIHFLGIVFLAVGLAGFVVLWYALRQYLRIVRIERTLER